jgi:3-oxoacyl-[acyl-carrier-protein] synthase II
MSYERERVLITGIGAVTPYGSSLNDFFSGLTGQQDLFKKITVFDEAVIPHGYGVAVKTAEACGSRASAMGSKALKSTLDDWGADLTQKKRCVFVLGSGVGGIDSYLNAEIASQARFQSLAAEIAKNANFECRTIFVSSACSSSSEAIAYACDLLRTGQYDLAVAGGTEELSQLVFAGFSRLHSIDEAGCRPFDKNRRGIMAGEGSVFFAMERESDCLGKKRYVAMLGAGITNDAFHAVSMDKKGTQIIRAMELSLQDGNLKKEAIDLIVAHATGTLINDETEAKCIRNLFGENLDRVIVTAPKGAIGHTGGASGSFGVLTAVASIVNKTVPQIMRLAELDENCRLPFAGSDGKPHAIKYALVNSFAFGGVNVSLLLGEA